MIEGRITYHKYKMPVQVNAVKKKVESLNFS